MIKNNNLLISISSQHDVVDGLNLKLWNMLGQTFKVWSIKRLRHQTAKITELENRICDQCTTPLKMSTLFIPEYNFNRYLTNQDRVKYVVGF